MPSWVLFVAILFVLVPFFTAKLALGGLRFDPFAAKRAGFVVDACSGRFGLPTAEHTRSTRIVVVEIGDQVVGIVVDGVSEVLRVNTATVEPPSPVVAGIDSEYLHGIAKLTDRLVILLDLDRILARDERRALETA